MAKSWTRRQHLVFVLIVNPIVGFVLYLDTGDLFICLAATILSGLLLYKLVLPLIDKLTDPFFAWQEKLLEKLKKRLES